MNYSKYSSFSLNKCFDIQAEKLAHEDCKAAVDVLNSIEKKYKDHGAVLDCIVFHNGTDWL